MSKFWSEMVKDLDPYVPGEQPVMVDIIKLNTNENPYGPSPKVTSAISLVNDDYLRLYPDPASDALKTAASEYNGLEKEQVFVGNGSDEVLAFAFQAFFVGKAPILFPDITYSFYPVYCGLFGIEFKNVPLDDDFQIQVAGLKEKNGGIIFPNPNAPTGIFLPLDRVEAVLADNPDSVVVLDEAYVDFGGKSAVGLISKYPNLLVVQTLSKARSLAGLRVGLAMGDRDLVEGLERVKNCFNSYPMDRLANAGAAAAFEDREYFEATRKKVMATRDRMVGVMEALGFKVLPSKANFVFATHPSMGALRIAESLREKSIVVRHFSLPRIDDYLRVTVGTDEQVDRLLFELKKILGQ